VPSAAASKIGAARFVIFLDEDRDAEAAKCFAEAYDSARLLIIQA
jgi:hypothetical protein